MDVGWLSQKLRMRVATIYAIRHIYNVNKNHKAYRRIYHVCRSTGVIQCYCVCVCVYVGGCVDCRLGVCVEQFMLDAVSPKNYGEGELMTSCLVGLKHMLLTTLCFLYFVVNSCLPKPKKIFGVKHFILNINTLYCKFDFACYHLSNYPSA